jgi:hypothetical protein
LSTTPPPQTKVYLLQYRANSFFAVGELELTDATLRCRVTGNAGWIAKELGIPGLKGRLAARETITAFEFGRERMKTKWLKQLMGGGFEVSEDGGKPWSISPGRTAHDCDLQVKFSRSQGAHRTDSASPMVGERRCRHEHASNADEATRGEIGGSSAGRSGGDGSRLDRDV